MAKKPAPAPRPNTPHVKRTYHSNPPHQLIRTTSCNCSIGADHSEYGT